MIFGIGIGTIILIFVALIVIYLVIGGEWGVISFPTYTECPRCLSHGIHNEAIRKTEGRGSITKAHYSCPFCSWTDQKTVMSASLFE